MKRRGKMKQKKRDTLKALQNGIEVLENMYDNLQNMIKGAAGLYRSKTPSVLIEENRYSEAELYSNHI